MAKPLTPHRLGLILGIGMAIIHAIWAIAVAISSTSVEGFYNWILSLHFINSPFAVTSFDLGKAALLVIMTAIAGYLMGLVFGWVYKMLQE